MGPSTASHDVGGHHGRKHARDHKGSKHRQRCSPAKLLEKLTRNAAHECRGQKHSNQREGGGDDGQPDLVGCLHRGLVGRLTHLQVALNVLHFHDRVINQHTNDQRQGQQGHHIDTETEVVHANKGRNGRQGQGHR